MKLRKLFLSTLFAAFLTQSGIASELSLGTAPINLEPRFVNSHLSLDKSSEKILLNVSSASELDAGETIPCEDHFSLPVEGAYYHKESNEIRLSLNGSEKTIGTVKGRNIRRVKMSENVIISHDKTVNSDGEKSLSISLKVI